MDLTASKIHGFTQLFLWAKFDDPVGTPDFHFELWDLMCSEYHKVAVAAPRRHAKSTAVTLCFVLAAVLFRLKQYVFIVSDTEGQAIEFLGDITRELEDNQELRECFGVDKLLKRTDKDIICLLSGNHEFRITAYGAEQKLRGRKWRNRRPDLVVCDDLENDEAILNEERRYKFRNWVMNALLQCGAKYCDYRFAGTILHQDSVLMRFMPKLTSPTLQTDGLRFWDENQFKESGWVGYLYQAHTETYDRILWAENYTEQFFRDLRNEYIAQGNPEGYAQEYLNRPLDDSVAYFRMEDLKPIKDYDEYLDYYAAADLAISTKDSRAYTAIVVVGVNSKGLIKVVDARRFRGDSLDICNEIFSVQVRYAPIMFAIEKENISKAIGPFLYEQMGTANDKPFINLREMPIGNQDKMRRARSIQARIKAGRVEFDTKASWWPAFQEELIFFPRGTYADQVDALAWIGILLAELHDAPTEEDIVEEEYQLERSNSGGMYSQGVCQTTGY